MLRLSIYMRTNQIINDPHLLLNTQELRRPLNPTVHQRASGAIVGSNSRQGKVVASCRVLIQYRVPTDARFPFISRNLQRSRPRTTIPQGNGCVTTKLAARRRRETSSPSLPCPLYDTEVFKSQIYAPSYDKGWFGREPNESRKSSYWYCICIYIHSFYLLP